ncbi:unnamed protein product [Anisakis simplex]|uniref:G_PROTEIN_RECEP_F1_2 domain-containing protein n=1 Tax=Anisakis simplex TaxID=6269 RepID=A0A0M3JTH1_ANISI|nr:unnamed protein product [Anisakis simplex]
MECAKPSRKIIKTMENLESYDEEDGILKLITGVGTGLLATINSVLFRVMSVILLSSIYLSFKRPVVHNRYFGLRNWICYIVAADIFTVIFSSVLIAGITHFGGWIPEVMLIPLFLITSAITVVLTVLAFNMVIRYYCRGSTAGNDRSSEIGVLISTIIYATPPNMWNFFGVVLSLTTVCAYVLNNDTADVFYLTAATCQYYLVRLRPLILTLSTLGSLPAYRKAIRDIFKKPQRKVTVVACLERL